MMASFDRFVRFTPLLRKESGTSPFRDDQGEVYDLDFGRGVAVQWPDSTVTIERMEAGVLHINHFGLEVLIPVSEVLIDASKLDRDLLEKAPDAAPEPENAMRCPKCHGLMEPRHEHGWVGTVGGLVCKNQHCRGRL